MVSIYYWKKNHKDILPVSTISTSKKAHADKWLWFREVFTPIFKTYYLNGLKHLLTLVCCRSPLRGYSAVKMNWATQLQTWVNQSGITTLEGRLESGSSGAASLAWWYLRSFPLTQPELGRTRWWRWLFVHLLSLLWSCRSGRWAGCRGWGGWGCHRGCNKCGHGWCRVGLKIYGVQRFQTQHLILGHVKICTVEKVWWGMKTTQNHFFSSLQYCCLF